MPDLINPQLPNLRLVLVLLQIQAMLFDPLAEDRIRRAHLGADTAVECVIRVGDVAVTPGVSSDYGHPLLLTKPAARCRVS